MTDLVAERRRQQQQHAGCSWNDLQGCNSIVLKPPKPQQPMTANRQWEDAAAAAEAGMAGLPPLPGRVPYSASRLGNRSGTGLSARPAVADVAGLVLLHPNLSGHQVPPFTRLLAGSSLGRSMLRPLLKSEVRLCVLAFFAHCVVFFSME